MVYEVLCFVVKTLLCNALFLSLCTCSIIIWFWRSCLVSSLSSLLQFIVLSRDIGWYGTRIISHQSQQHVVDNKNMKRRYFILCNPHISKFYLFRIRRHLTSMSLFFAKSLNITGKVLSKYSTRDVRVNISWDENTIRR